MVRLADGDIIKVGTTELLFKSLWLPPVGVRAHDDQPRRRRLVAARAIDRGDARRSRLCADLAGRRGAAAGPTLITTRPTVDADDRRAHASSWAASTRAAARSRRPASSCCSTASASDAPPVTQSLADWATAVAEGEHDLAPAAQRRPGLPLDRAACRPACSTASTPSSSACRRARVVYPTIYGRMRQGRARLTAADVSRLDELPYLEAYRPNLIDAVRLDLGDLAADPAPLQDPAARDRRARLRRSQGRGPGRLRGARARAPRRRASRRSSSAFPAPDADAAQASANLARPARRRGRRAAPARAAGGSREHARVAGAGHRRSAARAACHAPGAGACSAARTAVGAPERRRRPAAGRRHGRRSRSAPGKLRVAARWALARRGGAARPASAIVVMRRRSVGGADARTTRILQRRARSHPPRRLAAARRRGADAQLPRVGRRARRHRSRAVLRSALPLLPDAARAGCACRRSAICSPRSRSTARCSTTRWPPCWPRRSPTARRPIRRRRRWRRASAPTSARPSPASASIGWPRRCAPPRRPTRRWPRRARAASWSRSRTRCAPRGGALGIVVGWLVRAGGSGRRGETLRLGDARTLIGLSGSCAIRLSHGSHRRGRARRGHARGRASSSIAPLGGPVTVEGAAIDKRHALTDGETIGIGDGLFVFKSASAGNLSSSEPDAGRGARPAAARGRRRG